MFRIKARNLEAFVAHEERVFEERVARRLRDHFDHLQAASDEVLHDFVRLGRARANEHGIRAPYDVSLYIGIMAQLGKDFDRSNAFPWAEDLLHQENLEGTAKVEFIYARATEAETS